MPPFSLLEAAWLPVRRRSGAKSLIRPTEIATHMDDPIVAFSWGRPDFDAASREFMIGLLATAFPPPANNHRAWKRHWEKPPGADDLDKAFAPFAGAFALDGDGPRFMQDIETLDDAEETPVSALLIDAPGANTIKENKDLFQKRGQVALLSRSAAAMALFALQTFAPSGGAGHRTSLRGGGPLTTLAAPPNDDSLWSLLWLNTPPEDETFAPPSEERDRVFPWLAKTFASDGKPARLVAPSAERAPWTAHILQALWGAPRRIRLAFRENVERAPCPLTGLVDDVVVTGFRTRPWGASYDASFQHPLSPYYRPKGKDPWLPVHPQPGGVPYRDWPELAGPGDEESRPAKMTALAQERLRGGGVVETRLIACGYDMDNMKARGFVEAQMPLFILPSGATDAARMQAHGFTKRLVEAADLSASAAGIAVRMALAGERAKGDATPFAALRERFFQDTEEAFFAQLRKLFEIAETLGDSAGLRPFAEQWLRTLRKNAVDLFDEAVSFAGMPEKIMERAVPARRALVGAFSGYGPLGRKLFTALELPPPEGAGKGGRKAERGT
ncbi:type I-E CRISPR-associated protein Cse1/CasA [Methylocystis sp. S23]